MTEKIKKSITIDKDVFEEIEKIGNEESRKFSNQVNKILKDFIMCRKNKENN